MQSIKRKTAGSQATACYSTKRRKGRVVKKHGYETRYKIPVENRAKLVLFMAFCWAIVLLVAEGVFTLQDYLAGVSN